MKGKTIEQIKERSARLLPAARELYKARDQLGGIQVKPNGQQWPPDSEITLMVALSNDGEERPSFIAVDASGRIVFVCGMMVSKLASNEVEKGEAMPVRGAGAPERP